MTPTLAKRRLVRRHVAYVAVRRDEIFGEVTTESARSFDAPKIDRAELGRPRDRCRVSVAVVREVRVSEFAAARVEHGRGEGLAVRIDAGTVALTDRADWARVPT